jgi:hypothetical protein
VQVHPQLGLGLLETGDRFADDIKQPPDVEITPLAAALG